LRRAGLPDYGTRISTWSPHRRADGFRARILDLSEKLCAANSNQAS